MTNTDNKKLSRNRKRRIDPRIKTIDDMKSVLNKNKTQTKKKFSIKLNN